MSSYPKQFMKITELMAMGKTRCGVLCDIHSKYGHKFARRRGSGRGVWEIDTVEYEKYEEKLRKLQSVH